MSTKRIFVAIPLSEAIKDELEATIPDTRTRDLRWTSRENLHFTLCFVGDREEEELEEIYQKVIQLASERYPFQMRFKGFKTMYKNRKPSMVWAVFRESDSYDEFSADFSKLLDSNSLNEPIPHVTLGRIRNNASGFIRTPKMNHIVPFEMDVENVEICSVITEIKHRFRNFNFDNCIFGRVFCDFYLVVVGVCIGLLVHVRSNDI